MGGVTERCLCLVFFVFLLCSSGYVIVESRVMVPHLTQGNTLDRHGRQMREAPSPPSPTANQTKNRGGDKGDDGADPPEDAPP
ncbi:hypothetical protein AMTRI_Chr10g233030 [Amborella trichopoda]